MFKMVCYCLVIEGGEHFLSFKKMVKNRMKNM